jgi:3-polyprenyl-4-hydroxybenzoate decarboxylase
MIEDLTGFINKLKEFEELGEIEGANWDLEIESATYLAAKAPDPPALLFERSSVG